jgi:hypothetical protein
MNVAAETVVDGAIRPSGEYVEMMERLRGARDLFRELHPDELGFTYGVPNSDAVATEEHARGRCDYVLTFDRLPSESEDDAKPLRALDCAGIRTVSLGDDAPDRFAIEADLPTHQVIL